MDASACIGNRVDQMWANGIVLCVSGLSPGAVSRYLFGSKTTLASGRYNLTVGGPLLSGAQSATVYATGRTPVPVQYTMFVLCAISYHNTA